MENYSLEAKIICHCFYVKKSELEALIREGGLTTVEEVTAACYACAGCQTCRKDIEAVIREVHRQQKQSFSI